MGKALTLLMHISKIKNLLNLLILLKQEISRISKNKCIKDLFLLRTDDVLSRYKSLSNVRKGYEEKGTKGDTSAKS